MPQSFEKGRKRRKKEGEREGKLLKGRMKGRKVHGLYESVEKRVESEARGIK